MVNRVIRLLVLSDFVLYFALGLLGPIFAVFVLNNIPGSSLKVIGISVACYWVSRTLFTMPLSKLLDKTDGERDEFYMMVIGTFILSSVPLFYLLIRNPTQLYIVQLVNGLAGAMASPAWKILFTDHVDRGRVGYEWSLEDVGMGIATGISALIGSFLAEKFGFPIVLVMLSMLGYIATILLIPIHRDAKTLAQIKREGKWEIIKDKRKTLMSDKIEGAL